ncbi:hypothetical protein CK203_101460 [Vitis vinifera]|uniref:Reverse transcriptase Ty1/copia-type domain-containing protein n=1 Tax=Vitis vinifera TaxID=29760 RepID=A0A438BRE6_VITVI|nr:hypothetical protein CK203_101460 [Vitis vinifera]
MCFMAIDELDEGSKKDKWFLDSGCSRHMTGDESKFAFLQRKMEDMLPLETMQKEESLVKATLVWRPPWEDCKLKIEDNKKKMERIPRKKNHHWHYPPQQVQGESSQDLPKEWKFVINHPQDQIIEFSKCMHSEFEMSMMGELNFFLGLQIKQLKEGTFINQAKYIRDLLKRFNMEEAKTMKTPMSSSIKLDKDEKGKSIDSTMYRGMIGKLEARVLDFGCILFLPSVTVNFLSFCTRLGESLLPLRHRASAQLSHLSWRHTKRIHLGYLMMMHMISCCESTTLVLPYGRFLTRVFKDVDVDLTRETDFEAPSAYDMYDDQSMGQMKFEKALDGS